MSKLFETVDNFFDSHFDSEEVFEKCSQCGEYDYMLEGEHICPSCKRLAEANDFEGLNAAQRVFKTHFTDEDFKESMEKDPEEQFNIAFNYLKDVEVEWIKAFNGDAKIEFANSTISELEDLKVENPDHSGEIDKAIADAKEIAGITEADDSLEESKINLIKYSADGYTDKYKGEDLINYRENDFKKGTSVLMPFVCGVCGKEYYVKSNIHDFFRQGDFDDPYECPIESWSCPKCKDHGNQDYNGSPLIKEADISIDTDLESTHSDASKIENYLIDILSGISTEYNLDNIELWLTDKGNVWVRKKDGGDIVTLGRENFTDSDIEELKGKGYFDNYMHETNDDLGEADEPEEKPYIRNKESGATMTKSEVEDKWREQIDNFNTNEDDYPFDQYLRDIDETGEWEPVNESENLNEELDLANLKHEVYNALSDIAFKYETDGPMKDMDIESCKRIFEDAIDWFMKGFFVEPDIDESEELTEEEVPASQLDFKHEQLAKVQADIEVIAELKAEDTSNDLYTDLLDAYDKIVEVLTDAIAEDPVGTVVGTSKEDTGLTVDADNSEVNIDIDDSGEDIEMAPEEPSDEELEEI